MVFGLEAGKLSGFFEEAGISVVQIAERHLEGLGVDFLEPGVFFFEFGEYVDEVDAGLFFAFSMSLDALFKSPVVEEAGAAEVLFEGDLLVFCREEFVPESLEHLVVKPFLLQGSVDLEEIL